MLIAALSLKLNSRTPERRSTALTAEIPL